MASSALRSATRQRAAAAAAARSFLNPVSPRLPRVSRLANLLPLADRSGAGLSYGWPRCFSTSRTASSLNDPSPNWSNRPPKETILLDGCDFEHWLVVVDPPDPSLTRDEIIKSYIQTLAKVVGSEEEARMKIYSVSTRHYFAFGALVSEELSYKLKEIPGIRWVLPDSYLDVKNKDYGGEPFINGEAVPYDPKYHEEWVRNNARAQERNRRNDRTRDRSRNFERRRENMQNFQNRPPPPPPPQSQDAGNQATNQHGALPPIDVSGQPPRTVPSTPGYPHQMPGQNPPPNMGGPTQNYGGYQNPPPNFNTYQGNSAPVGAGPYQLPAPANGAPYQGGTSPSGGPYQGAPPAAGGHHQGGPPAAGGPYRGAPPSAGGPYQGGPGSYQGPYQGNRNVYQGSGGYQPPPNMPPPNMNQAPGGFQGPPNNYQGNPGSYQGASTNYQGFQGSTVNHQGNSGSHEGASGPYQGVGAPRDVPGRD